MTHDTNQKIKLEGRTYFWENIIFEKIIKIFVFLMFISLWIFIFTYWYGKDRQLVKNGIKSYGIIYDIASTPKGRPTFSYYYNFNGKEYKTLVFEYANKAQLGDTITIVCDKRNLKKSYPSYFLYKNKEKYNYAHEFENK